MLHIAALVDDGIALNPLCLPSARYAPFNVKYQQAYMEEWTFANLSFGVFDGGQCLMAALITRAESLDGSSFLNWYGLPAVVMQVPALPKNAATMFKKKFSGLLREHADCTWDFREYIGDTLSLAAVTLLEHGTTAHPVYHGYMSLADDVQHIWAAVRKSYRPLVNRSREKLAHRVIGAQEINEENFFEFRKLHKDVAGRVTRCAASWGAQYEQVRRGDAFLVTSRFGDDIVGASLYLLHGKCCYYGVGAYVRELFDNFPIAHGALWEAMLHAKYCGCTELELGEIFFPNQQNNVTPKEYSIGTFKKGFSGTVRMQQALRKMQGS